MLREDVGDGCGFTVWWIGEVMRMFGENFCLVFFRCFYFFYLLVVADVWGWEYVYYVLGTSGSLSCQQHGSIVPIDSWILVVLLLVFLLTLSLQLVDGILRAVLNQVALVIDTGPFGLSVRDIKDASAVEHVTAAALLVTSSSRPTHVRRT